VRDNRDEDLAAAVRHNHDDGTWHGISTPRARLFLKVMITSIHSNTCETSGYS